MDEHAEPRAEPPLVAAVSIKLPAFWPSNPQLWFAQVQTQFSTRGITNQKTMFDYVIASHSPEVAAEICDLILSPPAETPYDVLKEQLVKRTAASEQKCLQQLFSFEELGDRKPTQLLRRLQQLAGDTPGANGAFLPELFLQWLPANIRMVLASTRSDTPINEIAQLADKIIEVAVPQVASISTQLNSSDIEALRVEIASLKKQINGFKRASRRARSPHPRATSPHSRTTSPAPPSQSTDTVCWYHQTFGDSAHKCQTSCSFQGNNSASRSLMVTSVPGQQPSRLFYVTDSLTGLRFLVDTGAKISVVPPSALDCKHCKDSFSLQAVNNTPIATYGTQLHTLNIGLRCKFQWIFIIADVQNPILGADFQRHYSLLVNLKQNRLIDGITQLHIQNISTPLSSPSPSLFPKQLKTDFDAILATYPDIVQPCNTDSPQCHTSHQHNGSTCSCSSSQTVS